MSAWNSSLLQQMPRYFFDENSGSICLCLVYQWFIEIIIVARRRDMFLELGLLREEGFIKNVLHLPYHIIVTVRVNFVILNTNKSGFLA